MSQHLALQRLLAWLSPAFPVGGFAWSGGLETAIADGVVHDRQSLESWIGAGLASGGLRNDAIILGLACRSETAEALRDLADLILALTPARERCTELTAMGTAFLSAASAWPAPMSELPAACPYPVAVGAVARAHGIPVEMIAMALVTASVQSQISVAVRLVPLGQRDGLAALAALEAAIAGLAHSVVTATEDDLGGIAYGADIAQMRHETLNVRIFRS